MIIGIIVGLLMITLIGIAYYKDYKDNPQEFKFEFLHIKKWLLKAGFLLIIYYGLNAIFPLKNNGIEFNKERIEKSIPLLNEEWKKDKKNSNQFSDVWTDYKSTKGHFSKKIEYGIINPKTETDYYTSYQEENVFVWSIYEFKNNSFRYYKEKPNNKIVSVTEKGSLKYEKPTITTEISKLEFETHITKK